MAATQSKERKSLCEESMLLVVNILKFSSLSLARKSLVFATSSSAGDPPPPPPPKRLAKSYSAVGRRKAQRAPDGGSKLSYVMLPTASGEDSSASAPTSTVVVHKGTRGGRRGALAAEGDGRFEDYIRRFHEKTENEVQNAIVECKAADYIKRFHEKIRKDSNNDSKRLPSVVLPPHLHLSPRQTSE